MPYHPGLTRGLVAVLLYYDGRKSIATALRALVQARRGISWTLESSEEVVTYITQYTQELMEYGLISKILGNCSSWILKQISRLIDIVI
jgi:nuclear pore complex protein Nup205